MTNSNAEDLKTHLRIVFFDGHCNLCNSFVNWLMQIDRRKFLRFASLQGTTAQRLLNPELLKNTTPESVVYLRNGNQLQKSTAALEMMKDLGGHWKLMAFFQLVPRSLRDFVYDFVAKNRYRIFGHQDTCRVPRPDEAERLLP